jgi:hypothetical protein
VKRSAHKENSMSSQGKIKKIFAEFFYYKDFNLMKVIDTSIEVVMLFLLSWGFVSLVIVYFWDIGYWSIPVSIFPLCFCGIVGKIIFELRTPFFQWNIVDTHPRTIGDLLVWLVLNMMINCIYISLLCYVAFLDFEILKGITIFLIY